MSKQIIVKDEFRTNELSLKPGGHKVTVSYANGYTRVYERVKNPMLYVQSIVKDEKISSIQVDGKPFWDRQKK
jgi:hypothetical protein